MIRVKFKKLIDYAIPFKYTREGDACMDMYSVEDTTIEPNSTEIVSTGIALEIPIGFEGIVREIPSTAEIVDNPSGDLYLLTRLFNLICMF